MRPHATRSVANRVDAHNELVRYAWKIIVLRAGGARDAGQPSICQRGSKRQKGRGR